MVTIPGVGRDAGYAPNVTPSSRRSRPVELIAALVAVVVLIGCGGSGDDDQEPDEATFCRLALLNDPLAETSAAVLDRLEQLATDAIDPAVVVLRDAAEEMESESPGSPEAIAVEFEVRFRAEVVEARRAVEDYIEAECDPEEHLGITTTTSTTGTATTERSTSDEPSWWGESEP